MIEMSKLMRKSRTYIGPVAMALLISAVLVGLKHGGQFKFMQERLEQEFLVTGSFINAAFLTTYLLQGIVFTFLPLFTCMVCGDLIASETAEGTLRTMLCRPVTRLGVLMSKYVIGLFYVLLLVFGTGAFAYITGLIFLGHGSLINMDRSQGGIWIIPEGEAIHKLLIAYGLIASGMLAIGSISFAISTFLSNSNGAIAAAMGVMYGSAVIGEIDYFAKLKPYLLTTYMESWRQLFAGSPNTHEVTHAVLGLLVYSVVSLVLGGVVFCRRDVLS